MRVLVVGLGSMGKRRTGILQRLDVVQEVRGFDVREDRRTEAQGKLGIETFDDFEQALAWPPDAVIISTPPDHHMTYAHAAAKAGVHFFVEASVLDDGISELRGLLDRTDVVGVPSCTMRFHPEIVRVKELVDAGTVGRPCAVHYHMGQYLPDWHPHEDYRKFYVSRKETAATREMVCFELVWLSWIFGMPATVACLSDKLTTLEMDAPDLYQLLMRFGDGATASMMIDVVSRVPYRALRVIGEDGLVEWSATHRTVRVYRAETGTWEETTGESPSYDGGNFTGEDMYRGELEAFFGQIQGTATYPYDFEADQRVLAALAAAERSAKVRTVEAVPSSPDLVGES